MKSKTNTLHNLTKQTFVNPYLNNSCSENERNLSRALIDHHLDERLVEISTLININKNRPRPNKDFMNILVKHLPELGKASEKAATDSKAFSDYAKSYQLPEPGPNAEQKITPFEPLVPINIHSLDYTGSNPPPQPKVDGEFWYNTIDVFSTDGRIVNDFSPFGLHFRGGLSQDSDDLYFASTGALTDYILDPWRTPFSSTGRYTSTPNVSLAGTISAFTGYWHPIWAADDKWSKCWLHMRHIVLQFLPAGVAILGERTDGRWLFFEENQGRIVNVPMPGFMLMPTVSYFIRDPNFPVHGHVEVRLDCQIEGQAGLSFVERFATSPPLASTVILSGNQWHVLPS